VSTALTIGTFAGPTLAGIVIQHADYRAALITVAILTLGALPFSPPTARRKARLVAHACTAAPVRD
jgi:MFS family permease